VVVDKHGGSLTVDREVGHGTTFTLRLAVADAASKPTETLAQAAIA